MAVLLLTCAASTASATTNYGTYVGMTVTYSNVTEYSGTDPLPLFGAPTVSGNTLDFNPTFTSSASSGGFDITDGQLNFDVLSHSGYGVDMLSFSEKGDFTMIGNGTSSTFVDVSATFFIDIYEVDGVGIDPVSLSLNMTFSPHASGTFTLTGDGGPPLANGTWSGALMVDIENALTLADIPFNIGATKVGVALDNTLTSVSEANTSAFISKKDFKGFAITVVPEPSTFALLGVGTMLALLRRRK